MRTPTSARWSTSRPGPRSPSWSIPRRPTAARSSPAAGHRTGFFYQPTVIDQVPSGAGILTTEIFGPVAPVVRFTAEDDAVRWANDTEFGLVSYVYTRDLSRGL